jgi:hypothetical protein
LGDQASVRCPEVLEGEDEGLEGDFLCHVGFSISDLRFWIWWSSSPNDFRGHIETKRGDYN